MPKRHETRHLPFAANDMLELVADVGSYPKFLPWCHAVRLRKAWQEGHCSGFEADMVIKFKMFTETFTSAVRVDHANNSLKVEYVRGPFQNLTNSWKFVDDETGCHLDFFVDFSFRNFILQKVVTALFDEAMGKVVGAFETRAYAIYSTKNSLKAR
ncbi:MAG: type II toxin-antitoxin system RatA family toxin [Alphaproteobacteria bacterium]|nr:type II toxin-antitoxin system RatA family toxin [Alphaproteobacteria bacterium]